MKAAPFILLAISLFVNSAYADQPQNQTEQQQADLSEAQFDDFAKLSLDEILNTDLEVYTSGKQKQKLSLVPESMWVVTSEEIRRSGAQNIAELLRLVPGMAVTQLTPGHYEVAARDQELILANSLLLLIDGRPAYTNFFKLNLWNNLPVVIEEIDRIEVVLGPGSTMYGTSAMQGVVNIITKTVSNKSLALKAAGGIQTSSTSTTYDNGYVSGVWSNTAGKFATRIAGSFSRTNPWEEGLYYHEDTNFKTSDVLTVTFLGQYTWSKESILSLKGGASQQNSDFIPFYRVPFDATNYFADMQYTKKNLFLEDDQIDTRAYFRGYNLNTTLVFDPALPASDFDHNETAIVASGQYRFNLGIFTTTIGLEAEMQQFNSNFLNTDIKSINYLSAIIQEQISLFDSLSIVAGIRFEEQFWGSDTRFVAVPKASLVYTPAKNHVLRLSYAQAYQNPTLMEAYADISIFDGNVGILTGNTELGYETINAIEGGYQYTIPKLLTLKLSLYWTQTKDIIETMEDPDPASQITFTNRDETFESAGAEIGASITPTSWMAYKFSYCYNMNQTAFYDNVPSSPFHKIFFTIATNPWKSLEADLNLYVLSFYYRGNIVDSTPHVVNPIALLNLRIGYQINKYLAINALAYNILDMDWDDTFKDGALNAEHTAPGAENIGRRFMLSLEAKF